MSTSLRRKLAALAEVRIDRGATEHEQANAQAAIARILTRISPQDVPERPEQERGYQAPTKRKRRDRRPRPRQGIHIGDVIDCTGIPPFSYCKCGSGRWEVCEGTPPLAYAWLRCTGCRRARKLTHDDFKANASGLDKAG